MSGINLDFTDVSTGFEVLPAGNYDCAVKEVELKDNRAGDGKYLNFKWEVISSDIDEEHVGRIVFDIASLKPKALWKLKEVLDACGMESSGQINLDPDEFIGQEATLTLAVDEYQGRDKNVVKKVLPLSGASSTDLAGI